MNQQFFAKIPVIILLPWLIGAAAVNIGVPESVRPRHPLAPDVERSRTLMQLLAPTLLGVNERGEWVCQLCAPNANGELAHVVTKKKGRRVQITSSWTLRKNMKWGDGTTVTNKDIILTWQMIRTTKHPAYTELLSAVEDIRPDDKNHYIWHVEHRQNHFNPGIFADLRILPAHLEAPIWREQNNNFANYLQKSFYQSTPQKRGLYAGYYLPAESAGSQTIQLTRNPAAPPSPSAATNVRISNLENNEQVRQLLHQQGEVLIEDDFAFGHQTLADLKKRNIRAHLTMQPSNWLEYISFNIRNPALADSRIRHALVTAIDRSQLLARMQLPVQPFLAKGLFLETDYRYAELGANLNYNRETANQLLHESGWLLDDKEKVPVRKRGEQRLHIELIYDRSSAYRSMIAKFIAESWRHIGVDVELESVASSKELAYRLQRIDYTGAALFARHMDTGMTPTNIFSSKLVPSLENDYYGQNFSVWRNSKVDAALELIDNAKTTERHRSKQYQIIAAQFSQDLPALPLFFHPKVLLTPKPVAGMKTFYGELPGILRLCSIF